MKKLINIVVLALIPLVLLNCGKDDPKPGAPTLTAEVTQTLVDGVFKGVVGSPDFGTLSIHFEGSAPAGFQSLELRRFYDGNDEAIITFEDPALSAGKTFTYDYEYSLRGADVCPCVVTIVAELTDKKGNKKSVELAKVDAHWPLYTDNLVALTNDNDDGLTNGLDYFFSIKILGFNNLTGFNYETMGVSLDDLSSNGAYGNVHLLFNRVLTHHFISPNAANGTYADKALVEPFTTRNTTLVRIATLSSLSIKSQSIIQNLDEYAVFSMIELFNNLSAGASPEVATLGGDIADKIVMLKLADGRVCLIDNMQFAANIAGFSEVNFRLRMVKHRSVGAPS